MHMINLILISLFFALVSTADVKDKKKIVLIPKNSGIPDYEPISRVPHPSASSSKPNISPVNRKSPKSRFELLPSILFTNCASFMDFASVFCLMQTCKTLYLETEDALENIRRDFGIVDFGGLTRRDQIIFLTTLAPSFTAHCPGLKNKPIGEADLLSLYLLGTILDTPVRIQNRSLSMPAAIPNLSALAHLDFMIENVINHENKLFSSFVCSNVFSGCLFELFDRKHSIPYTLEALSRIKAMPDSSFQNNHFNLGEIPLLSLAASMAVLDSRFIDRWMENMSDAELIAARIGGEHLIHALLTKSVTFDFKVFNRMQLHSVALDRTTTLSFYSTALVLSLRFQVFEATRALLLIPASNFPELQPSKLEALKNCANLDDLVKDLLFDTLHIIGYLMLE